MSNTDSPETRSNHPISEAAATQPAGEQTSSSTEGQPAKSQAKVSNAGGSTNTKDRLKHSSRVWKYLCCFFLGIFLSFAFNLTLSKQNNTNFLVIEVKGLPNGLSQEIRTILVIIVFGAFGGLLYSLQSGKVALPHVDLEKQLSERSTPAIDQEPTQKKVVYLGVVADCLIGIGGALVVFLLLPIEGNIQLVKLLATATIGGYGGRSLLDQALGSIVKKQEELQEKVDQANQKLDAVNQKSNEDADALKLLSLYLDTSLTLTSDEEKQLIANIKGASRVTRTQIFERAQAVLVENRKLKESDLKDKKSPKRLVVENALKVFQALQESDQNQDNHRYPAHISYAYMALGNWQDAIKSLEEAKRILENTSSDKNNEEYQQNQIVYESNRLICKLKINKESDFEENFEILKQLDDNFNKLNLIPEENQVWSKIRKLIPMSDYKLIETWVTQNQDKNLVKQWIQKRE